MATQPITELIASLGESHLLRPAQLLEVNQRLRRRFAEPQALLQALLVSGWLTAYQVRLLLQGQAARLVLGSYVLLDQLGEGGMGQVFKARQHSLDRVVALKVLRPELVSDSEAVSRFYREIKVASQLPEHPNLVRAFDAGPAGATHFLAMEYVAGTDLERLVKQSGPLSIAQACDFIRQAALGLQHAHEHGLVHRDIKPSNLLASSSPSAADRRRAAAAAGIVKILDLGLARLQGVNKDSARENTFLTTDGTVTLGTVDYQAPEQALDFHRADIRADIYSLGCTCYYLLTGKPPFGSGPLAIKLMRHQQAQPPHLKEWRADVPDGLAKIVDRMLAKRPADRYQTPGEVAEQLAALSRRGSVSMPVGRTGVRGVAALSRGLSVTARGSFTGCRWVWQRARGHPRLVLSVVGVLLLLAGSLWLFTAGNGGGIKLANPFADTDQLRKSLIQLRMERPGTLEARVAVEQFMKLPSPLDRLDPKSIPADGRLPGDPRELVAVLGQPGQKRVQSVAFSPDGKLLACGDSDNLIRLWGTAAGTELTVLKGHPAIVYALAFSPDGKTLASGGGDVRLWDVASGQEQAVQKPVGDQRPACLAYSPDGKTLAVAYAGAGVLKLWDMPGNRERIALPGLSDLVFTLGFSADGRTVAVTSYQRPVKTWNVADGAERPPIPLDNAYCVAYVADGQTVVVVGEGTMKLWDVASNLERSIVPVTTRYDRLALSPDGSKAVTTTSGGAIAVWGLPTGAKLHEWKLPNTAAVQYHFTYVPAVAPDGRHLAVAGDNGKVYVFRMAPPAGK